MFLIECMPKPKKDFLTLQPRLKLALEQKWAPAAIEEIIHDISLLEPEQIYQILSGSLFRFRCTILACLIVKVPQIRPSIMALIEAFSTTFQIKILQHEDMDGCTALMHAAHYNPEAFFNMLKLIKEFPQPVQAQFWEKRSHCGESLLFFAVCGGHISIIDILFALGLNKNIKVNSGKHGLLEIAARCKKYDTLKLLIEKYGVKPYIGKGSSLYGMAVIGREPEIISLSQNPTLLYNLYRTYLNSLKPIIVPEIGGLPPELRGIIADYLIETSLLEHSPEHELLTSSIDAIKLRLKPLPPTEGIKKAPPKQTPIPSIGSQDAGMVRPVAAFQFKTLCICAAISAATLILGIVTLCVLNPIGGVTLTALGAATLSRSLYGFYQSSRDTAIANEMPVVGRHEAARSSYKAPLLLR